MSDSVLSGEDRLLEYVLGTGDPAERQVVERQMQASPALRREADDVAETLASAAADAAARDRPKAPANVRARLLATVGSADRFAPFLADLVRLFELPADGIRSLLARIDQASTGWERRLKGVALEASELFHFAVGPRLAAGGAAGGVLRIRAGEQFPAHHHDGDETTFVLEGTWLREGEEDGRSGPGSTIFMPKGSYHTCRAAPERDLVVMVLHHGITFPR